MSAIVQPLARIYEGYLDCLNRQDWPNLGQFVAADVRHDGRSFGLAGYRAMLEGDFRAIPDLQFRAEFFVVQPPMLGCRLVFDCTPVGEVFGIAVNGRRVRFDEHVFYRFENDRIVEVWSIIDEATIARQVNGSNPA
jgi:predicted ester cyclase